MEPRRIEVKRSPQAEEGWELILHSRVQGYSHAWSLSLEELRVMRDRLDAALQEAEGDQA